jgi:hypothetical protein
VYFHSEMVIKKLFVLWQIDDCTFIKLI